MNDAAIRIPAIARRVFRMGFCLLALLNWNCSPPSKSPGRERPASLRFEDVTAGAGLRFQHFNGADGRFYMPELLGSGVAFLDYDGDGRQDLFLVNSANWPDRPPSGTTPALYRNLGDGRFRDVTREAGLAVSLLGMGCAVGDFDNDGRDDLFVSCVGPNRLFRNEGGRFRDVSATSRIGGGPPWAWHTSATWLDYDRDGFLDLFVCRYVHWSPREDIRCTTANRRSYCGPKQYLTDTSELYRNLGNGSFEDVSRQAGITAQAGKGLGVLAHDVNGDGYPDLVVANDLVPNHLWINREGKRFEDRADEMGIGVGPTGEARAGMGIDLADVRSDGTVAIAIGNFNGEGLALFRQGDGFFEDDAVKAGLMQPSLQRLTFGLCFLDADLDGNLDLLALNGHVDPHIVETGAVTEWKQRPLMLRNTGGGQFADVSASAGPPFQEQLVGRGAAWGDFDDDGRPDLLLCDNGGPARLLRNVSEGGGHWLGVQVVGKARGLNRNGFGAEVRLAAGGVTQRRWLHSGGSYLSDSDHRALFGLGRENRIESLEIRWPNGQISKPRVQDIDRYVVVAPP